MVGKTKQTLKSLLAVIDPVEICGSVDVGVTGLACDSRQVERGNLFFALPGVNVDGFRFLSQALSAGAVAVIADRLPEHCDDGVCYIRVADARRAMALIASQFYGNPTADAVVIGVTGTNGKTSTTYLLEAIFRQAGYAPAVFGTVEYRFGETCYEASRTTPESIELLRLMAEFRHKGADVLILEASSHALEQHRVDGIDFNAAIFTNLTQDHLDYHQTFEAYFSSKKRLFTELLGDGYAAINGDDKWGRQLLELNKEWISYGLTNSANVYPTEIHVGRDHIRGSFASPAGEITIESGMIGEFNVYNLLAAAATAVQLGISCDVISRGVAAAPQVPGRVEKVENTQGVLALVDYSHTEDALEQALKTLSKLDHQKLITVVGCGGDRDKTKRPKMAAVAVRYSDVTIFTSDNPRTEDPLQILEDIRRGALNSGGTELAEEQLADDSGFIVIPDRRAAIELAGRYAQAGDLLLVAGKGHESYQILGTTKVHFDDREELSRVLNKEEGLHV